MQQHTHMAQAGPFPPADSGTFGGHVLPGSLFLLWAAFWVVELWRDRGARPADAPFERSLVGIGLKIVLPLLGVIVEWPEPTWEPHNIVMNYQHAAMYGFFALSGVVDLAARRGLVPRGATYLAFAAAALNGGALFLVHDAIGGVSKTVHMILGGIFVAAAGGAVAEWLRPGRELHWLRLGAMLMLGAWFYQVAWLLYRSGYDLTDHVVQMRAHLLLSVQAIAVGVVLLALRAALARAGAYAPAGASAPARAESRAGRGEALAAPEASA
jgi:hypothetical protein